MFLQQASYTPSFGGLGLSRRLRSSSLALETENQTILPVMSSAECRSSSVKNFRKNRPASRSVTGDCWTTARGAKLSGRFRISSLSAPS